MRSVSLRSGHCLVFVLLLAPVLVQPNNLEFEDNAWISPDTQQNGRRLDKMKSANRNATTQPVQPPSVIEDPTIDRTLRLLDATDPSMSEITPMDGSMSQGGSSWIWAIVASLCVAGAGLACFSFYWSHTRRMTSW